MTEERKAAVAGVFARASATYDEVIPYFERFGWRLVEQLDLVAGEAVLDVACGQGASLVPAAVAVGPRGRALGVDLAGTMVARATAALRSAGLRHAEVGRMDAERLALADASFDAALLGFGIQLLPDAAAALAELRRVLRPGGRAAVSTFAGGVGGYPWMVPVIRRFLTGPPRPSSSPVDRAEVLGPALVAAGFDPPTVLDVAERFVFADEDAFLAWMWSHGSRGLLERLAPETLPAAVETLTSRLRDHAVDGGYELVQRAQLSVAVRP